jgi:hypothetical protein
MTRKKVILSVIAILGLGGLSLYFNRDWFAGETIQISHRVSPWLTQARRGRRPPSNDPGNPVTFTLNKYYGFNSIKVYVASEIETNKYAHPIWDLVSESNSRPTMSFGYGSYVRGMHPAVKNARPDPLEPGVKYRLLVKAGDEIGQHDFTTTPKR